MTPTLRRLLVHPPTHALPVQALRYVVVGGASTVVDMALLWTLTDVAGIYYLVSSVVSFAVGFTVSAILSLSWVFPTSARSRVLLAAAMLPIAVSGLALNVALLWALTEFAGMHYLLSKAVATAVVFAWNFLARRVLLFSPARAA